MFENNREIPCSYLDNQVQISLRLTAWGRQFEAAIVEQTQLLADDIKKATAQLATPEAITAMVAKEVQPIMQKVVRDCINEYFCSDAGEALVDGAVNKVVKNNASQLESTIKDAITDELQEKVTYELKFGNASQKVANLITDNISNLLAGSN